MFRRLRLLGGENEMLPGQKDRRLKPIRSTTNNYRWGNVIAMQMHYILITVSSRSYYLPKQTPSQLQGLTQSQRNLGCACQLLVLSPVNIYLPNPNINQCLLLQGKGFIKTIWPLFYSIIDMMPRLTQRDQGGMSPI